MSDHLIADYEQRYETILVPVARRLMALISAHLKGTPRIDRVSTRAKDPPSFVAKARRYDSAGRPQYSSPLVEIQDQIGARVVVFYERDVATVESVLLRYFRSIEQRTIVPDSEWKFGYFGKHYILALPTEALPAGTRKGSAPRFFELQIKTLFQHAWAEAEHDLGYKPAENLTHDQERRLAFTAAQAWGADRMFLELANELLPVPPAE